MDDRSLVLGLTRADGLGVRFDTLDLDDAGFSADLRGRRGRLAEQGGLSLMTLGNLGLAFVGTSGSICLGGRTWMGSLRDSTTGTMVVVVVASTVMSDSVIWRDLLRHRRYTGYIHPRTSTADTTPPTIAAMSGPEEPSVDGGEFDYEKRSLTKSHCFLYIISAHVFIDIKYNIVC